MASNLFGQPSKNDIKLGYIDPELGYINDVTICDANEYGKNNPGTTFIFQNGNNVIQYLSLNEVNNLNPTDLESNKDCEGINQKKPCGPPIINFYGGDGIGAQGNPVIGIDGSILAVDIVRGGNGYQYPPQVSAIDNCNYGSGAVLTAVIGETAEAYETYETEEDFEEYKLCDENDVGFGRRYGPNGEDLGPWEPSIYTKIGGDPIKTEIDNYQKIVRALSRTPFWDTRKKRPTKITSSDSKVTVGQPYNVTFDSAWNEFMNTYAVSPVPPSNVKGSDYAGILFTMEWNEEFPLTGEYTFRGLCDNKAQLYIDNEKISDLGSFADPVRDIKKTIKEGAHNIRVDLLNVPIYEVQTSTVGTNPINSITPKFIKRGKNYYLEVTGSGKGQVDFVMDVNDSSSIAGLAAKEVIIPSDNDKLKFTRKSSLPKEETIKNSGTFTAGKTYGPIQINGASSGVKDPKADGNKLNFYDTSGNDVNIKLLISKVTNSQSESASANTTSSTSSTIATTASLKTTKVFNTVDYIDKADRKLWRTNVYGRGGFINDYGVCPFDTSVQLKDNPYAGTHRIVWDNIDFPVEGSYNIDIEVDDNVTLKFLKSDTQEPITITKKGFSAPGKGTGKTTESRFFTAGKYKIIAELEQIPGGKFGFSGIKGTNPMALAVNIDVVTATTKVVSSKSWNENPMGVSITIDAPPEPPPPQEVIPAEEGRCPNNPIWSTRFPSSSERWYPVNFPGPRKITTTVFTGTNEEISDKQEVQFEIFASGVDGLSFVFTSVDGRDSFTFFGPSKDGTVIKEKVKILKNTNYIVVAKEDSLKFKSVEQGLIKGGTKDKEQEIGTSNKIFADYIGTKNDNNDIQVTASAGTFTSSNKRKAKNSGRNTYDLVYRLDGSPAVKNTATSTTTTYDAPGWSKFMNRYAISPVKPLDIPGSDRSGSTYSNSWDVIIPYDGFYGVRGTRDNRGRLLIDNKEISTLDGFNVESPKLTKVFLTKGTHKITVEVYNQPVTTSNTIEQKIFRTKDWQVSATSTSTSSSITAKFIQKGKNYYLEVTGSGTGQIDFVMDVNDASYIAGLAAQEVAIPSDGKKLRFTRKGFTGPFAGSPFLIPKEETIKNSGTFTAGKTYGPIEIIGAAGGAKTPTASNNKLSLYDAAGTDENIKLLITKVTNIGTTSTSISGSALVGGTVKDGVTYDGPSLFSYKDSRWGSFMNDNSVSPFLPPLDSNNPNINGIKKYIWKNVKFPESGQYKVAFQADNIGTLYIGETKVLTTTDFTGNSPYQNVNVSEGTYDIIVELENVVDTTNIFNNNPTGFALEILKNITLTSSNETPWSKNPMGISAILIPPPCPKKISGRGVVKEVKVRDPGNGYFPPSSSGTYPVSLRLVSVDIENPGINYNCGVDKIQITPSNGAVLDYVCDTFGRIKEVKVLNPGFGFTEYPDITMVSPPGVEPTGINASFRPQFEVVRDPIVTTPQRLIQVTDLVGLKQNGYIDGRAYYGSVFYKDGVRYAGFYETPGQLVQVYNTLQESITAQVTTTPSAIQRSGTDTELSSNNPKLNIPNTPENLI